MGYVHPRSRNPVPRRIVGGHAKMLLRWPTRRGSGEERLWERMAAVYRIVGVGDVTQDEGVLAAAEVLSSGGLALMPTETVYGLGVSIAPLVTAPDPDAMPGPESGYRRIFSVKQRDLAQTTPWLVADVSALDTYGCDVDDVSRALAEAFWPGALTLIVRAREDIPAYLKAADGTIALRASASPVVAALIAACASPLAVTSANTHGEPAPSSFAEVELSVLAGVDVAIDAGETPCQDASTIVSCLGAAPVIIRQGALSAEAIMRVAMSVAAQAGYEGE